jgi:phosphorylcholine metabolism protein LicD
MIDQCQIDSTFYVATNKIFIQIFIVTDFVANDARRETWIRKVLFLKKLMKQRKKKRFEKNENILAIRKQLFRLVNFIEIFENIARWIVNVNSIVCRRELIL